MKRRIGVIGVRMGRAIATRLLACSDVCALGKRLGLLAVDLRDLQLPLARALERALGDAEAREWCPLDPPFIERLFVAAATP